MRVLVRTPCVCYVCCSVIIISITILPITPSTQKHNKKTHRRAAKHKQGIFLVADTADEADAWADALLLAQHLVATRSSDALAEALTPQPSRRAKAAAAVSAAAAAAAAGAAGGGGAHAGGGALRQGGSPHAGAGGG